MSHVLLCYNYIQWGHDLQSEHEQYLVSHYGDLPLFVTDFPASVKAFYARENDDDSGTVGRGVVIVDYFQFHCLFVCLFVLLSYRCQLWTYSCLGLVRWLEGV